MAKITGIRWASSRGARGHDIHVLWNGTSPLLKKLLVLDLDNGSGIYSDQATGTSRPSNLDTITFSADYNAATAHVSVDGTTGRLVFSGSRPNTKLRNFLVCAQVKLKNPTLTLKKKIRIHIHDSIKDMWLSPGILCVPQGSTRYRFSVLAEFDDKVVGDFTYASELKWTSDNTSIVSIKTGERENGVLVIHKKEGAVDVTVTHSPSGRTANGTVSAKNPWSTPREVEYLGGKGKAGAFQDGTPNILFIPDGFDDDERDEVKRFVLDLVDQLRNEPFNRPYDYLRDSIRYWLAWVPSAEKGGGILCEMRTYGRGPVSELRGRKVPQPAAPTPGTWRLDELIHEVGLPVPVDDDPTGGTAPTLAQKTTTWTALFGAKVSGMVTPAVYRSWRRLCSRRLLQEPDTSLGLTHGERPRAEEVNSQIVVGLNPRRASRQDLHQLLSNLTYKDQPTSQPLKIGDTWTITKTGSKVKIGADAGLVCLIARSQVDGGTQFSSTDSGYANYFTMTIDGKSYACLQAEGTSKKVKIEPAVLTERKVEAGPEKGTSRKGAKPIVTSTCAHECAHAFGLGDEYGGGRGKKLPASAVNALKEGNLQPRAQLEKANKLSAALIKWRWPRLAAAGVLKEIGTVSADRQTVDFSTLVLQSGQGRLFKQNDIVQVRWRNLLLPRPQAIGGLHSEKKRYSALFRIDSVSGDTIKLRVDSTLGSTEQDLTSLILYQVGDLLVSPILKSDNQHMPLVSPKILNHIDTKHGPLDAPFATPERTCTKSSRETQFVVPTNLPPGFWTGRKWNNPSGLKGPKLRASLVGLYEGGKGFDCGVYHAAGTCKMRGLGGNTSFRHYPFCHICSYLIVERIDPTKHKEIDADYAKEYPEP